MAGLTVSKLVAYRRHYLECASSLLDDVYAFQIAAALQPQHGVHSQPGKVLLVLRQNLGAARQETACKWVKKAHCAFRPISQQLYAFHARDVHTPWINGHA